MRGEASVRVGAVVGISVANLFSDVSAGLC